MNCGTEVKGRFCHFCGQENIEPRETVWGLITHFFHDITHFDGKFFTTVKWLVTRPGYLSREYILGRRARHLHPIRMYIFSSAVFFLLFFTFFFKLGNLGVSGKPGNSQRSPIAIYSTDDSTARTKKAKKSTVNNIDSPGRQDSASGTRYRYTPRLVDSSSKEKTDSMQRKAEQTIREIEAAGSGLAKRDTAKNRKRPGDVVVSPKEGFNILTDTDEYSSVEQYDSVQKALPPDKRDGWLERNIKRKEIRIDQRIQKEGASEVFRQLIDKFMHSFPQILFISLPLVAAILQLLYIRRRKQFYYVNHGIFLIHIYIYSFINLTVYFCLDKLKDAFDWGWLIWLQILLALHAAWYVYKAMRKFYGQGRFKTFSKFILLNILTIIVINILFIIFFIFSAWNL